MGAHRVAVVERERVERRLETQTQAAERAKAEAQLRAEENERLRGEENMVARAAEQTAIAAREEEARTRERLEAAEQQIAAAADELEAGQRELARVAREHERHDAELTQLKRRALRAEREAQEAVSARERALDEKRTAEDARAKGGERPVRPARPRRRSAPRPAPEQPPIPLGPPLEDQLAAAREEEAAARGRLEQLQAAAGANGDPSVERVDAEADLERASEEVVNLERRLDMARERVERMARSHLKRSSRGALKDATARLAGTLSEGEEVLHMAAGGQRDGRQLIAATDRRLLVLHAGDAPAHAVAYEQVESVQMGRRGTLEVMTATGELKLEYVVGDLQGLVQHVNQRIWDVLHSSEA
jgi:myosin heavy subunit